MIHKEQKFIDGSSYIYTYADIFKIRKVETNELYDDALDIVSHDYEETDIVRDDISLESAEIRILTEGL